VNESQIIAWLKTYVYAAPEVQLEMIREMAQRFCRLQARITELEGELKQMLTATLTSAQEYEKILLGKNERIAELEANTAGQEKLLQMYVGLAHSWTVLAHGQADQITKLDAEIDRLRQQELGIVDSGDDEDDE